MEITPKWNQSELSTATKKEVLEYLHKTASNDFLARNGLRGKVANLLKVTGKGKLDEAYNELFECKEFRSEGEEPADTPAPKVVQPKTVTTTDQPAKTVTKTPKKDDKPKFSKVIMKKGDGCTFPENGQTVTLRFKGICKSSGKVFQSCLDNEEPLKVKAGARKLIEGWDEAVLTMSLGEKARITIEPEFAYGAKGLPPYVPPNETLIFEAVLVEIN
eukprot:TRINITY_DN11240_c0_g1_i1.p1 TRINITY_DN11240_c0_g1~~TRINITY_DN11240_c0_g1_i1.p1  ORF type:complete len:226 (-),score=36.14 TRINITY_DN11240_c0_g1_i1:18-668(-)